MDVNRWRLRLVSDEHNAAQPKPSLQVHVGIAQIRSKVNAVCRRDLVHVNASTWRRASKPRRCGRRNGCHAHHTVARVERCALRHWTKRWRGERLLEHRRRRRGERILVGAGRRHGLLKIQGCRTLREFPLRALGRKMDVVVLAGVAVKMGYPAFRERRRTGWTLSGSAWRGRCICLLDVNRCHALRRSSL